MGSEWDDVWKLVKAVDRCSRIFNRGKKKHSNRKSFPNPTKRQVLLMQNYQCAKCHIFLDYPEFHHKDGDSSNNSIENCEALCPNCHAKVTRKNPSWKYYKKYKNKKFLRLWSSWRHIIG